MADRAATISLDKLWALVVVAGVFIIVSLTLVQPHDYWWHVRVGEWIADHGRVPRVDHFSYTQAGQSYTYQMWLAEVAMYLLHRIGDLPLAIFAHALAITFAYGLLLKVNAAAAGGSLRWASIATLAAAALGLGNWNVRPQSVTFPLLATVLFLIDRHRRSRAAPEPWHRSAGALWWLPVVFALWANLHGGFVFGLVLLGCYWLSLIIGWMRRDRSLSLDVTVIALLSGLAALLTPRGVGVVDYVLDLFRSPVVRSLIVEWSPPTVRTATGVLFYGYLIIGFAVIVASRFRLTPFEAISSLAFALMALMARRNVAWFGIVSAPVLARALGLWRPWPQSPRKTAGSRRGLNLALAGLVLILSFLSLPWLRPYVPLPLARQSYVSARTPIGAVEFLSTLSPTPRAFHNEGYGSYMMWACPEVPVFIDTRFELYPEEQWEDYLATSRARYDWMEILNRYDVDTLVLERGIHDGLIEAAAGHGAWEAVYGDDLAVVLRRLESR